MKIKALEKIIIITIVLTSCNTNQPQTTVPCVQQETEIDRHIGWDTMDMVAVAFLGYFDNVATFENSEVFRCATERYKLKEASLIATEGDEYYLVIPRDRKASISVNQYSFEMFLNDQDPASGDLIYKGKGTPFFLKV